MWGSGQAEVSQRTQQLRRQSHDDKALGDLSRDTQGAFGRFLPQEIRVIEEFYKEPMTLGQFASEPTGIELLRVINLYAPEVPVKCGSLVHYTFKPLQGGAVITSIDGLSMPINGTQRMRFVFRITYPTT
jgi:hypothetical protein